MNLFELITQEKNFKSEISTPYVIAEAGVNHEGSMDLAKRLINEAAEGGAHAIKFQTYKAESIASKHSPAYWDITLEPTNSQYKLFKKYDKFWKTEYELLAKHCQDVGIEFLSTPFDIESANFLNELMDVFKISSSDLNNKPFVEYLCGFKKPIVLSTGASYMWEVEQSVSWINNKKCPIALLHCVLNYPTDDRNANLAIIPELIAKFPNHVIGYSDHTLPKDMKTLEVATLLGAKILEKHFTFDKKLQGNDHYHSMDKDDLKSFLVKMLTINELLGSGVREPLQSELLSRANARRSLVSNRKIEPGEIIAASDLTWKRPAQGIDPREYDNLIGKTASVVIDIDTVLTWDMFR